MKIDECFSSRLGLLALSIVLWVNLFYRGQFEICASCEVTDEEQRTAGNEKWR